MYTYSRKPVHDMMAGNDYNENSDTSDVFEDSDFDNFINNLNDWD